MSRNKSGPSRSSAAELEMQQIWHGVVDTLRLLPTVTPALSKPSVEELRSAQEEKAKLDEALEKLSVLIALRRGEPGTGVSSNDPIAVSISTPNAGGPSTPSTTSAALSGFNLAPGGNKRKRRLSYSASPAPPLHLTGTASTPNLPNPPHTGGSADSALTSVASPLPSQRQGTPLNREMTIKQRKELYSDQLPLLPGRKVAFKEPNKHGKGGMGSGADNGDDVGEDSWILATVKKCLAGDKHRYEVADADDDQNSYNTTLRSIIPLPDPSAPPHLSSHPSNLEDFPKGTQVLALYPDTTSFYRAKVIAAPIPGTGMGLGIRGGNGRPDPGAKREKYRLEFVDDESRIQEVHKDVVVAYPT